MRCGTQLPVTGLSYDLGMTNDEKYERTRQNLQFGAFCLMLVPIAIASVLVLLGVELGDWMAAGLVFQAVVAMGVPHVARFLRIRAVLD